jgi:hypothetical protein
MLALLSIHLSKSKLRMQLCGGLLMSLSNFRKF